MNKIKDSLRRLKTILGLQAESYQLEQQTAIAEFVVDMIQREGKCKLHVESDQEGNYYLTKGAAETYPCVVAHLDQVHDYNFGMYRILEDGDTLFAISKRKGKWSTMYEQVGTGGDDLVGVWLCVELALKFDAIKIALFVDEEVGCIGSGKCDLSFFDDCSFILQGDRRGHDEWIEHTNGVQVASPEFKKAIKPILKKHKYDFGYGTITDAGELACRGVGIVCANVACGYYDAHFDTETVSIKHSHRCLKLMSDVISSLGNQRWEWKPPKPKAKKMWGDWYKNDDGNWIYNDVDDDEDYFFDGLDNGISKHTYSSTQMECPRCESKGIQYEAGFYVCMDCGEFCNEHDNIFVKNFH